MKRSGYIQRKTRIRPRNPKRHTKERDRSHGDSDFRAWMKRQPCVVCGRTPSDAAHLKSGGTGRKDDVSGTVPLCSTVGSYIGHHDEYDGRKHAGGKKTFAANHPELDLWALAAATQEAYQAHQTFTGGSRETNRDDERGLGARGAVRAPIGDEAGRRTDPAPAGARARGTLTPLAAIVPRLVADLIDRSTDRSDA